jgi:hypothetical protein
MAVQILCLACGVNIEAEESPNWQVVPCFKCNAPLRMPVAGPKIDDRQPTAPVVPNKPSRPVPPVKAQAVEPPPIRAILDDSPTPVPSSNVELARPSVGPTNVEVNRPARASIDEPAERRRGKRGGAGYKLTLILGYFLFVIIPLGGSIYVGLHYYNRMVEERSHSDAEQPAQGEPADTKNKPEPKRATASPATPEGYTSPWEKVGPVEVRIAGVAIRHVPIINAEKLAADSPLPVLAIWVDTRVTGDKTIELRRWQSPSEQSCRLTTELNEDLPRAPLGPGAILRTGTPSKQVLGPNSHARVELLVFTPPPDGVNSLTLKLDAVHVGEEGNIDITIPASAWKK